MQPVVHRYQSVHAVASECACFPDIFHGDVLFLCSEVGGTQQCQGNDRYFFHFLKMFFSSVCDDRYENNKLIYVVWGFVMSGDKKGSLVYWFTGSLVVQARACV